MSKARVVVFTAAWVGALFLLAQQFGLTWASQPFASAPTPMVAFIAFSVVIIALIRMI